MSDEQNIDSTPPDISDHQNLIEELKTKAEEYLNNWKRSAADFDNYKKRKENEIPELVKYGKEMMVMQLIPSLQSLEQVLTHAPVDEKYKDWLTGLRATIIQLEKTMEEMGVFKIKTTGEKFDPNKHEAVEEIANDAPGVITKEIQPGFILNDRVIVPAKVVVGK